MDRTVDVIMIRRGFNECMNKLQGVMTVLRSEDKITPDSYQYICHCFRELDYKMTCLESEFYKERQENQKQAGEQQ